MSNITQSCPYCHGDELGVNAFRKKGSEDTKCYTVACRNVECQSEGPIADSPEEAIEKWNKMNDTEKPETKKTSWVSIFQTITGFLVGGIAVSLLWSWFIVPLGVPSISIVHAIGIDCLITFLTSKPKDFDNVEDQNFDTWVKHGIILPLAFLIIGVIIRLLM